MSFEDPAETELRRRQEASRRRLEESMRGMRGPPGAPLDGRREMFSQRKRWVWMAFLVWLIVPGALVVNMILRVPAGPGFPSAAALAWFTLCAVKIVDADRGNHAVPPALKILGWIVLLAVLTAATFVALWFAACALLLTMSTLGK